MNCQDIADILDNRLAGLLDVSVRAAAQAHMDGCADCARDWRLQEAFAALPDMVMPADFEADCRALVASAPQSGRGRRGGSRLILIGTMAMVAAAAAMLGWSLLDRPGERVAVMPAEAKDVTVPFPEDPGPLVSTPPAEPAPVPMKAAAATEPVSAAPRFTVHVLPLINEGSDAASTAAIAAFHAAFLDELRAVPGLALVHLQSSAQAPSGPDAYALTVRGMGPDPQGRIDVVVGMDVRMEPGGAMSGRYLSSLSFIPTAACAGPVSATLACDPATQASKSVAMLRTRIFPSDPGLMQQVHARLLDPALDPASRFSALTDLASLGRTRQDAGSSAAAPANPLHEAAVVRGAIELATVADAEHRAEIWRAMRGARSTALIDPLIAAARTDPDRQVRVQAVATLAADFADDAVARPALESMMGDDSYHLVRALARRGLAGEESWKEYVGTSLRDSARSPSERVEALLHHMQQPSPPGSRSMQPWPVIGAVLDDATTVALVDVLPAAYAESGIRNRSDLISLASSLVSRSGHPAVKSMLLEALDGRSAMLEKRTAMRAVARRGSEPGIREALQKIAAEDADPTIRDEARRILEQDAPAK